MAMINVPREHQQQLQRIAGGVGGAAVGQLARMVANELARMPVRPRAGKGGGSGNKAAKKKKQGKREEDSAVVSSATATRFRSIASRPIDRMRVHDRFILSLPNSSTNQVANYFGMSLTTTTVPAGPATLSNYSNKLAVLKTLYRHYALKSVKITWMPNQADSTSGNLYVGWDSDASNYNNTTSPTAYLAKDTHIITHILKPATTVWRPREAKEREERYTTDPLNSREPEELSFGVLQVYSNNNVASGVVVGLLLFEVDVEFSNPVL